MTALPLAALTTRPIQIPVYRNERIRKFALWFADNDTAIAAYFNALKPYCEEGCEPLVDFFAFSAIQHEREELKLQESDRNQAASAPSDAGVITPMPRGSLPNSLGADPQVHITTPRGPAGGYLRQVLGTLEVVDERLPHGSNSL